MLKQGVKSFAAYIALQQPQPLQAEQFEQKYSIVVQ
jgi:hypothetical protein